MKIKELKRGISIAIALGSIVHSFASASEISVASTAETKSSSPSKKMSKLKSDVPSLTVVVSAIGVISMIMEHTKGAVSITDILVDMGLKKHDPQNYKIV